MRSFGQPPSGATLGKFPAHGIPGPNLPTRRNSGASALWGAAPTGALFGTRLVSPPNALPIDKAIKGPAVCMRNGKAVRRFTPADDEKILSLSLAGKSDTEISRALDRRPNSIRGRLMTLARHQARAERLETAE
jgi:hypothetical protein